jgi:hypothetical protein
VGGSSREDGGGGFGKVAVGYGEEDIKLYLIKANIIAKKRKEDLAILLVDTSGMDDDVKAWCAAQRTTNLAESRAPPAPQPSTATPPATTPLATGDSPSNASSPITTPTTPTIVPDSPVEGIA